jgi:fructose-1,6-bisphosphatase/inositol monophosphatase family enzyme
LYTTLVAVLRDDLPWIGVIFAPAMNEMVYAASGAGCWHQVGATEPQPARVSQVADLSEARFLCTCVHSFSKDRGRDARAVFDQLAAACRVSRTWGDAFGYLLVATGRAEIMMDAVMNLWDAAALQPIIEEAGGKFFDWQGRATIHGGEGIATNSLLAERVQQIVAGY